MNEDEMSGDPRGTIVLIGLGYGALVIVAFWLDYKIRKRRARKKREEAASGFTPKERTWFKKGEKDDD